MFYFWYFLSGSLIFYLAYTVYATPWVALGYELTPDYHERTRLMGVQNFIGQLAYIVAPWFLWIMQNQDWFDDMASGAASLAIVIAVFVGTVGILPALFLRERFKAKALVVAEDGQQPAATEAQAGSALMRNMTDFFRGFLLTLKFAPFLKLCAATFLVFNGFMLIASFQFYVIIYYVFGGDTDMGAKYAGYSGTIGAVSTFVVIVIVTWLGTKIGKRRAFFVATGISMLGYALKWVCYNPDDPLATAAPGPADGVWPGRSLHADAIDDLRRRRHGRTGNARTPRRHVWLDLLVGGEAGHGRGAGRQRLPAQCDGFRRRPRGTPDGAHDRADADVRRLRSVRDLRPGDLDHRQLLDH